MQERVGCIKYQCKFTTAIYRLLPSKTHSVSGIFFNSFYLLLVPGPEYCRCMFSYLLFSYFGACLLAHKLKKDVKRCRACKASKISYTNISCYTKRENKTFIPFIIFVTKYMIKCYNAVDSKRVSCSITPCIPLLWDICRSSLYAWLRLSQVQYQCQFQQYFSTPTILNT